MTQAVATLPDEVVITQTSLEIHPGASEAVLNQVWNGLKRLPSTSNWLIGDFLLFMENTYGEDGWGMLDFDGGIDPEYITVLKSVANKVPARIRREGLSWTLHRRVMSVPESDQIRFLNMAEKDGLSSREIGDLVKEHKAALKGDEPPDAPVSYERPTTDTKDAGGAISVGDATDAIIDSESMPVPTAESLTLHFDKASEEEQERFCMVLIGRRLVGPAANKKGTLIDPDYWPSPKMEKDMMDKLNVGKEQLDAQTNAFKDHFCPVKNPNCTHPRKKCWDSAWRHWFDRGLNWNGGKGSSSAGRATAGQADLDAISEAGD